jgi:peptidoglycan/LPS O-acetylase OafA/YrhL
MHRQFVTLTGIRGAAAVWVVTFHAYALVAPLFNWPDRTLVSVIRDGFLAVDLFFILSGFVLSHAYAARFRDGGKDAWGLFLAARVRRIFPLHWVCLAVTVLLVMSFPDFWHGPGPYDPYSLVASALLLQNCIPSMALAWNSPAWSLSAEWIAYLLFPLLAWSIAFVREPRLALGGAVLALLLLAGYFLGSGLTSLDHAGKAGMVRCLTEFLAGALIWKALQDEHGLASLGGDIHLLLGGVLLAIAVAMPSAQLLAPFAFAAIIVGCVLPSRGGPWLFGNWLIVSLGEISFSMYLIHAPLLGSVGIVIEKYHLQDSRLFEKLTVLISIPIAVVGASVLLWRFVETPGRTLLRSPLRALPS